MIDLEHIPQEELAQFAMQSLPEQESAAIRRHLAACALCRDELAELTGDLALLALSVEQHPAPEGARERFLARLQNERRTDPEQASVPASVAAIPTGRRRGVGYWTPWAIAAALGIVAIALGVQNSNLNEELNQESNLVSNLAAKASRAQQVLEVLTAPSAQRVTLTPGKAPTQPTGRAVYLPERGALIFQASNLKPLPAAKAYELWVIPASGKAPVAAGVFQPDANGAATLVLPHIPSGIPAKAFGVTIEAAQGSETPTTPIILSGQ